MQIRTEDIESIVTAVEWLLEGGIEKVVVRQNGSVVFAARRDDSGLVIDPEAMSPDLARHLLEQTSLFDREESSNREATPAETSASERSPAEGEPRRARA